MRWIATAALLAFLIQPSKSGAGPGNQDTSAAASSVHLTAEQDHQQMIDLLHITSCCGERMATPNSGGAP
jgi:hypothetical protein